jgi:hypothetical protein
MPKKLTPEQLADAREYDATMKAVATQISNLAYVTSQFPMTKEPTYSQLSVYHSFTQKLLEAIDAALALVPVDEEWIEATKDYH